MKNRSILKAFFIGIVFFSILEVSCDRDDKPTLSDFQFPIAIGNSWTYARAYTPYNWVSLAEGAEAVAPVYDTSITKIISLDNLDTFLGAYRFETDWFSNGDTGHSIEYYNNAESGLFLYAYSGASWTGPPKINPNNQKYLIFDGRTYSNFDELRDEMFRAAKGFSVDGSTVEILTEESHPIEELDYPLTVGKRWMYRDAGLGDSWDMDKQIVRVENISVSAGKENCFKIQWFWDTDDDGVWDTNITGYDYLSPIGYLKRQFNFSGVKQTNEVGDTVGTFDVSDIYELIDYHLNE